MPSGSAKSCVRQLDQAYPALVADLAARGLLDETLVVLVGEFGRSPRINKAGGHDHWGTVFSACLAGAGLPGGRVIGGSDRLGAEPASRAIGPAELAATVLHLLGIRPEREFHDRMGRPQRASASQPRRFAGLSRCPSSHGDCERPTTTSRYRRFAGCSRCSARFSGRCRHSDRGS